jgi:hypothetical protein
MVRSNAVSGLRDKVSSNMNWSITRLRINIGHDSQFLYINSHCRASTMTQGPMAQNILKMKICESGRKACLLFGFFL